MYVTFGLRPSGRDDKPRPPGDTLGSAAAASSVNMSNTSVERTCCKLATAERRAAEHAIEQDGGRPRALRSGRTRASLTSIIHRYAT